MSSKRWIKLTSEQLKRLAQESARKQRAFEKDFAALEKQVAQLNKEREKRIDEEKKK